MPKIAGDTAEAKRLRRIAYENRPWTPARDNRAVEWHDRLLPFVRLEQAQLEMTRPLATKWCKKVSPFPWTQLRKLRDEKLRAALTNALGNILPPELRECVLDELVSLPGITSLEVVDEQGALGVVEQALPLLMERLSLGS